MRRFQSHALIAMLAAFAAACGNGDSPPNQPNPAGGNLNGAGVHMTTDRASYPSGAPVELTIFNQEADDLAYNACTRELEVREGASWVPGPVSLRLCTREVWYVNAGASRIDTTDLDLGLVPGEYRIVLSFIRDDAREGEQIRAVTNAFLIEP